MSCTGSSFTITEMKRTEETPTTPEISLYTKCVRLLKESCSIGGSMAYNCALSSGQVKEAQDPESARQE